MPRVRTKDSLEFLGRLLAHIPDTGQVTTRYYGWSANRPYGMRRKAEPAAAEKSFRKLNAAEWCEVVFRGARCSDGELVNRTERHRERAAA